MNCICDTAKECGSKTCNYRLALPEHVRPMLQLGFMCVKAGHRVHSELVAPTCCAMEAHTCYFCNHEGTDVNRIAVVMPPKEYCCDDAVACDHRWSGGNDRLERGIRRAINGELFMHSLLEAESRHKLSDVITARVMELVNEPLS